METGRATSEIRGETERRCPSCGAHLVGTFARQVCERCLARALLDGVDMPVGEWEEPVPGELGEFGDYEIEGRIGHGGMGVVYRARHRRLNRVVAIKLLLMGRFAGASSVRRFLREARAAARLHHPHIIAIHEIGEARGSHFLVMEHVAGCTLAELARGGPLPPMRAARYAKLVAAAVHYAHAQGVVHRDLKPSNVLIDPSDQPRITDFGLARCRDDLTDLTATGDVLGTPNYLSPEQACGQRDRIGPGADIYSVGAILYELVTGRPPFLAASLGETLMQVREREPAPPAALNPGVPADLESIILKCLEKEPARRYPTAASLAEDLGRFLDGTPTLARPVGMAGRMARWARRRPVHAALVGVGLAAVVVSLAFAHAAGRARLEAERARAELAASLRRVQWLAAEESISAGRVTEGLVTFARLLRDEPDDPVLPTRLLGLLGQRSFALPGSPPLAHGGPVTWVAVSSDERRIVSASVDGSIRLWNADGGSFLRRMDDGTPVMQTGFVDGDRAVVAWHSDGITRLWRTDGRLVRTVRGEAGSAAVAAISRDRTEFIATISPTQFVVCDARSGERVSPPFAHTDRVREVDFHPGAGLIASGTDAGVVTVWDRRWPRGSRSVHVHSPVVALAWSPDGSRLAVGTRGGALLVYATRLETVLMQGQGSGDLRLLRFSPDGARLVAGRFGKHPEIWSMADGRRIGVSRPLHDDVVLDVQWSSDSRHLLSSFRSGAAVLQDAVSLGVIGEPFEHQGPVVRGAIAAGRRLVATASQDGSVRLWGFPRELAEARALTLPGRAGPILRPSGDKVLVSVTRGAEAFVCDALTGMPVGPPMPHGSEIRAAVLSPAGDRLLTGGRGARVWDVATGKTVVSCRDAGEEVVAVAWLPDGRSFLTASREGRIAQWDATSGAMLHCNDVHVGLTTVEAAPDGRTHVVLCADATARVFDTATGAMLHAPLRHRGRIWTVDYSFDGRRIVTASVDRTARVWSVETGLPIGRPLRHDRVVLVARFSPDGRRVATGGEDNTVRLWDAETGSDLGPPLPHPDRVWILAFSPDGRRLVTAADHREARVWDVASGVPVTDALEHPGTMLRAWFIADGSELITSTHAGLLRRWSFGMAPAPAPAWLPDLVESIAGRRIAADGNVEATAIAGMDLLRDLAARPMPDDVYARWARWYHDRLPDQPGPVVSAAAIPVR